jgi:transketolase
MPEAPNSDGDFATLVRAARLRLLRMHYQAGVGHIGGNLSALDAMLFLHHRVMTHDDLFVLSKGHAAGALYVTLWTTGELSDEQLSSFHGEGSKLAGHPAPGWTPGIRLATGSLGHGLPAATGVALARRLEQRPGRVFCLTSDGEWQEGSNWEALVLARHQQLDNLVLLVDENGLQGFGTTDEVASLGDLRARFEAFGIPTLRCDGHDAEALAAAIARDDPGPRAIVLDTVKGKGVSFMENEMAWHYLPLDDALYERAVAEVEAV